VLLEAKSELIAKMAAVGKTRERSSYSSSR
jgi:hypothetical protein